MRQSTKRFASAVAAFILILAALIVYFDLTKPTFDEIQQIRGDELNRQQILGMQQSAVDQVKKLLGTYAEQSALQDAVSASLPLKQDVSTVLAHLAAISSADRIQLQSVALLPSGVATGLPSGKASSTPALVGPVSSFILQVKGTGSYEDFKIFAKDLESDVRLMDVKDIIINPAGRPDQDLYVYDMRFKVYYQNLSNGLLHR